MLLIHLGFPHLFTTWIMSCISSASFNVLINGSASHFFHAERGLRQGCPLSPLLFLIVMEGLSRLIAHENWSGKLFSLKINDQCYLTHLLFFDDVLIFLDGSIRDSIAFDNLLSTFSRATSMLANHGKSTITLAHTFIHESQFVQQHFPYCIALLTKDSNIWASGSNPWAKKLQIGYGWSLN